MRSSANRSGALQIAIWAIVLCVSVAGIPKSAGASAARLKQFGAGSLPLKSTAHKIKSGRLFEAQKVVSLAPEPVAVRPDPIALAPSDLPTALYAAPISPACPARAPPSHLSLA